MSTQAPAASEAASKTSIVKVVFASLIGTAVEWYDFFLYGSAAALVFGTLFFPESEPATATLLAFGTYALGFVARPLGGIVFGHYGDKVGRKKMLVFSLFLMGVATFAIGLLPTYEAIGVAAPPLIEWAARPMSSSSAIRSKNANSARNALRICCGSPSGCVG